MSSLTWKRQPELFKFDSRRHRCKASMQGKTARIWRAFGGERDNSRQKRWFRGRKVSRKPGMLPQTNLLKCMRSSWQNLPLASSQQCLHALPYLNNVCRQTKHIRWPHGVCMGSTISNTHTLHINLGSMFFWSASEIFWPGMASTLV